MTDLLPVPEEPHRRRPAVTVRVLGGDDWSRWRELRLRALQDSPSAFGSTYAQELAHEEADWRDLLEDGPR